jgi:hypothetical protein
MNPSPVLKDPVIDPLPVKDGLERGAAPVTCATFKPVMLAPLTAGMAPLELSCRSAFAPVP